jgi:hypothetical protein
MGMKVVRKIAVAIPGKDDKTYWLNLGVLLYDGDPADLEGKKFSIKQNSIPIGIPDFEGWLSCFEIEEKGEGDSKPQRTRREPRASSQRDVNFDDDIPF